MYWGAVVVVGLRDFAMRAPKITETRSPLKVVFLHTEASFDSLCLGGFLLLERDSCRNEDAWRCEHLACKQLLPDCKGEVSAGAPNDTMH